jgi:signal recognition particle receptor subunit beta
MPVILCNHGQMALVNHTTREINAKIVYYGPGLCGKTTNIHLIYHRIAPNQRGKLISLSTETDRTLFFDFLPVELGTIKNYHVRFHLYTVPGQVFYNATRKLVLKGADGVIFVADSQRAMMDANLESLANLRDNFAEMGIDLADFPMVIQYNKRDLPDIMAIKDLNDALNPRDIPFYEAIATTGDGVLKTFTAVSKLVLQDMQKFPERHNFTLRDVIGKEEKRPLPPKGHSKEKPPVSPSMPDAASTEEATPGMAAPEKDVNAGMRVNLGKPFMDDRQIILPFDVLTRDREDQFQLRVAIDMEEPLSKRFKVVVKNFKK